MDFDKLSPELKERAKAAKSADEVVEIAKSAGVELSDEELSTISGGSWNCDGYCSDNECYWYNCRACDELAPCPAWDFIINR